MLMMAMMTSVGISDGGGDDHGDVDVDNPSHITLTCPYLDATISSSEGRSETGTTQPRPRGPLGICSR